MPQSCVWRNTHLRGKIYPCKFGSHMEKKTWLCILFQKPITPCSFLHHCLNTCCVSGTGLGAKDTPKSQSLPSRPFFFQWEMETYTFREPKTYQSKRQLKSLCQEQLDLTRPVSTVKSSQEGGNNCLYIKWMIYECFLLGGEEA